MQKETKSRSVCLICGKLSARLICLLCAGRLRREALREEIDAEKHGKRPTHLTHD